MSENTQRKGWWTPVRIGLCLTAFVLLGFVAMAFQRNCILLDTGALECQMNWRRFWTSKPNEIGDTLAGFAGTLAFIWIVVTVWLQSIELGEQREVLIAQKEEFKAMVAAQNAQVEALRAQAAVLEDERRRRDEAATGELIEENLNSLFQNLSIKWLQSTGWTFSKKGTIFNPSAPMASRVANMVDRVHFLQHYDGPNKVEKVEQILPHLPRLLDRSFSDLIATLDKGGDLVKAPSRDEFMSIAARIGVILPLATDLSPGPRERLSRLKLSESLTAIEKLVGEPRIWIPKK